MRTLVIVSLPLALMLAACGGKASTPSTSSDDAGQQGAAKPLLVAVPADHSGIAFLNHVEENMDQNYFIYEYIYNGGGVAVGDLNNDGLQDIYFTGNLVDDKLYLNKGDLHFEDVTARAIPGKHEGWHSGVTMADVNNDGLLDIYVCRAGWWTDPQIRTNLFYQNMGPGPDGVPTFTERAAELGIADTTRSTQAAFFDHDRDGDLDLLVLNWPLQGKETLTSAQVEAMVRARKSPTSRLYRNDGVRFTDITADAGLWMMGYALGVAIEDLNQDGYQDIYIACDYIEPDKMFINDGRGHYRDEIRQRTRHISNYGMGCDAADYDNDGLTDLLVLDMVSEDHVRSKKNMGAMAPDKFWATVAVGYHYQYMFNSLQHNNGNGTFSELGQLAGVSKTDWSWAPLFCDLDNDGWKDLLITNGYKRDTRDNDYNIKAKKLQAEGTPVTYDELLQLIPTNKVRNYLFRNDGKDENGLPLLSFSNVSEEWGFAGQFNSNGAAYADLDNDGDLDLVINNEESRSVVYANQAVQQGKGNFLRVRLEGNNTALAYGARVIVTSPSTSQMQTLMPTRGFQSSVESILHFGLGDQNKASEVRVEWPDGTVSRLADVSTGQVLEVKRSTATPVAARTKEKPMLAESAERLGLDFRHVENPYDDYAQEVLLPHKQSENGPLLSVGDANGDGREDLFVGGARGQGGQLFLQTSAGTFSSAPSQAWAAHKDREDMGSLFFDADGDQDQDLFVVSGSNEVDLYEDQFQCRLYLNGGRGDFTYDPAAIPSLETSALRVCASDVDADGDQDLFLGGRITPGQYPRAPRSYLLINDGQGHFSDETAERAPDLMRPGLVTQAVFTDNDGDSDDDLVIVGEWMPILFMRNDGGRFSNASAATGLKDTEGLWWSLAHADVDGDGDTDLIAGGLGWNHKFHCAPDHPFHVYSGDLDDNGHPDIVLAKEQGDHLYPVRGRQCSSQQCPSILEKFPSYDAFAHADVAQIYAPEKLSQALHLEARHMRSCLVINDGGGKFHLQDLPAIAQAAPIMSIIPFDVNGDGNVDLIMAGNHWGAEVETVRYDGGTGLILTGDGKGGFTPMSISQSGFFAWGNVKDLALLKLGRDGRAAIVVANNNDRLQAFVPTGQGGSLLSLRR